MSTPPSTAPALHVAGPDLPGSSDEHQARGLRIYAAVIASGFLMAILLYDIVLPRAQPTPSAVRVWDLAMNLTAVAACAVAALAGRRSPQSAFRWAAGLHVYICFVLSVPLNTASQLGPEAFDGALLFGVPWVCVILVIFPLIVPGRTRDQVSLAWFCASFEPASILWTLAQVGPIPAGIVIKWVFPVFMCAGLATVSSVVTARLAAEVAAARRRARELGSYRLERKLGGGGMGEVWLAQHRMLKRPAAVKLIKTERLAQADEVVRQSLLRFEREAQRTANLRSQHTVELYDYGRTEDGSFYYVMELLDGVDLDQLVTRHGPQPPGRVVSILSQACLALAEAHTQGLIHRDVKPANIHLCRQGPSELDVVKVLDFGLVLETTARPDDARLTGAHQVLGTPSYMAPETALDEAVDPRADLYALGCVGYWLLTGELVFPTESPLRAMVAHAREVPAPPSSRITTPLPADLDALILDCLAKDPADRPPSAAALRARLLACAVEPWDGAERWWSDFQPLPADDPATRTTQAPRG